MYIVATHDQLSRQYILVLAGTAMVQSPPLKVIRARMVVGVHSSGGTDSI